MFYFKISFILKPSPLNLSQNFGHSFKDQQPKHKMDPKSNGDLPLFLVFVDA